MNLLETKCRTESLEGCLCDTWLRIVLLSLKFSLKIFNALSFGG